MNKKEAIQAMLDGKKVRISRWDSDQYAFFDGFYFKTEDLKDLNINSSYSEKWSIYEELVLFEEALRHMREGNKAKLKGVTEDITEDVTFKLTSYGIVCVEGENHLYTIVVFDSRVLFLTDYSLGKKWVLL